MPPPPPLPAAVPANVGCIRRRYSLRKLRIGFSTGSPSAARRSALERDAAANPSRGVRLGRRRGPRATAPSAARLRPLRASPRRPVLLLLLLFAGEEAGRQSEEGPVDFDFLALLSKPKTLGLLRSYTHVRNYSSQLSGLIPAGPQSSKLTRRHFYFPNASPYQLWSRSFASDSGEKFEAVVPFMGESVTDGTLAD